MDDKGDDGPQSRHYDSRDCFASQRCAGISLIQSGQLIEIKGTVRADLIPSPSHKPPGAHSLASRSPVARPSLAHLCFIKLLQKPCKHFAKDE